MTARTAAPPAGTAITERIAYWAHVIQAADFDWHLGAIFPGEMAGFLAFCEAHRVRTIIESGRQDGYSTQALGEFSQRVPCEVFSIDLEKEEQRAASCRQRLQDYPKLHLLRGDTFAVIPNVAHASSGRIALLVDGPKLHAANRLSLAATAAFDIVLLAHHNSPRWTSWGKEFICWFPSAVFYEETGVMQREDFRRFKEWERHKVADTPIGDRSLESSSLAIAPISSNERRLRRLLQYDRGLRGRHPFPLFVTWKSRAIGRRLMGKAGAS